MKTNKRSRLHIAAGFALLVLAATPGIADIAIAVDNPIISSPDRHFPQYLDGQLEQAFAGAAMDLTAMTGERVTIARGGRQSRGAFSISVIVSDSPEYSALILNMSNVRTGAVAEPFNYTAGWDDNLHRTLRRAIVYLYSSVTGVQASAASEPVLLTDISTGIIKTTELGYESQFSPYGLATDNTGDLLVAGNSTIVRFDRYFREQAKLPPPPQANQYSWAGRVATSSSNMLYAQAITGGDLWEFSPDLPTARRIRTGGQSVASLAVMDDGSVVLHDQVSQQTTRIRDDQRQQVEISKGQYSYIFAIAGGPDNTIWTWDITSRMASISDPGGYQIDVVIPLLTAQEAAMVRVLVPYPNGDVLLGSPNGLYRFSKTGMPVWTFSLSDHPLIGSLLGISAVAFDAQTGLIYVNDPLQGRVFQILDVAYAESLGPLDQTTGDLVRIGRQLRRNPDDADAFSERAEIFEQLEAWIPAFNNWDAALASNPSDGRAADGVDRVELALQLITARATAARAREVLSTIGRASAQTAYFSALAAYEQLLANDPRNREIADEMDQLVEEFEQPIRRPDRNTMPLTVISVDLDDVFPALSIYYRSHPIGQVTIRNELDVPATAVQVTLEMSVMEFPTRSDPVPEIAPGDTVTIPVFARLAERTLSQRGRLLVQPRVSVEYDAGGSHLTVSEVTEIFAHSNTAITWDDSQKLAAFIMPDEQIASDFGSRYANVGSAAEAIDLSERLFRAIRLADVVGSMGITYVEDPLLGISEILGESAVVDSVRYPRDTLRVEAGDCDDTTALLCTLYEATGIRTAIMTSPGHVFMAFDTGEPRHNAWLFNSDTTVAIEHGGTVWLPLETTILSDGFTAAWAEGSRLWNRYEPSGEIEFLPVHEARALYEPIPTSAVGFDLGDLDDPIAGGADMLYDESFANTVELLYTDNVAAIERTLRSLSDRQKIRTLNKIGVLHARFDETRLAERSFNEAIELDPEYTTSYINLANLKIIRGEPQEAVALLDEVTARRPDSILANLLLAQANQMMGNQSAAHEFMVIVEEQAPELASQYPHLTGGGVGRASEAQSTPVFPWPVEDE
jgi:tetratricopeptide (TPR) repeat protein